MDRLIKQCASSPYSEDDMRALCEGKVSVMSYGDAVGKASIDDVMGQHGAAIILIETKPNYGHWVALIRVNADTIEWFDSYGMAPDAELKMVPQSFRRRSAQDAPYLSQMIAASRYSNVLYNKQKLQSTANSISTCGRWAALRVQLRDTPLQRFQRLFVGQRMEPDFYVTCLTMYIK